MIIRFRLERAARMLSSQTGKVGEIASAVGFKNLSHFAKRFREQFGQTPTAYAAKSLGQKQDRALLSPTQP